MLELVLVYCLISDAQTCVEKRQPFMTDMTPDSCMKDAQTYAEQYLETHPQWRLASWRCELDVPHDDPA